MSFSTKFSQQITDFQRYGKFVYEFDDVGNVIMNSSSADFSEVYLSFPLQNVSYDNSKIEGFYNPEFVEFIPRLKSDQISTEDVQKIQFDLESANSKNVELTKQLDDLISVNESTPSLADEEASKQVILELRKSLGQGRVDSDFSTDFPYTPIQKPTSLVSGSTS